MNVFYEKGEEKKRPVSGDCHTREFKQVGGVTNILLVLIPRCSFTSLCL